MRVIVLGSGVVGVTSAWFLARAGHEVVVLDRQPEPGFETSFANAGQISPGYAEPWAAPDLPLKALKWLFARHAPLIVRPRLDPEMWRFCARMLRNCSAGRYERNKARMVRLAHYSRQVLQALRGELGIDYDGRQLGTLQLFRDTRELEAVGRDVEVLRRFQIPWEVLDVDGCLRVEPGLAGARDRIAGGLRLPGDETGDCFKFTQALAREAAREGVELRQGTSVAALLADGDRIRCATTDSGSRAGRVDGDAYVAALGSYTPALLAPLGIRLPVYPVKGYSITVPIVDADLAPVSTVMDERYKIVTTRLGDRIRVAGMAELCGHDLGLRARRRETLERVMDDLFSGAGDVTRASFWTGLRPMTPDGPPVIGPTRYRNLYVNSGHGTLGWTMSCGSGRVVADLVSGRPPEIDLDGLTIDRYR